MSLSWLVLPFTVCALRVGGDATCLALSDMELTLSHCSALPRAIQQLHKSRRPFAEGANP